MRPAPGAADIIRLLDLRPHPEGGHFRETFRDARAIGGRAASTAIYFLLARGERSHWHRVDATEGLALVCGRAPLSRNGGDGRSAIAHDARPRSPGGPAPPGGGARHAWQAAESLGDWTLAGCTVAPGFEFSGFDMAAKDWSPG